MSAEAKETKHGSEGDQARKRRGRARKRRRPSAEAEGTKCRRQADRAPTSKRPRAGAEPPGSGASSAASTKLGPSSSAGAEGRLRPARRRASSRVREWSAGCTATSSVASRSGEGQRTAARLAAGKGGGRHPDGRKEAALAEDRVHHVLACQRLNVARAHGGSGAERAGRAAGGGASTHLQSTSGSAGLGRARGGPRCWRSVRSAQRAAPAADRAAACSWARPSSRRPAGAPGGHGPCRGRGPCLDPGPGPCSYGDRVRSAPAQPRPAARCGWGSATLEEAVG